MAPAAISPTETVTAIIAAVCDERAAAPDPCSACADDVALAEILLAIELALTAGSLLLVEVSR